MNEYYCDKCDEPRGDRKVCPACLTPTRLVRADDAGDGASEPAAAPAPPRREKTFAKPRIVRSEGRLRSTRVEAGERADESRQEEAPATVAGADAIEEYLDQGFGVFLIVGVAGSGKTELLEAYRAGKFLGGVVRKEGRAMPTPPSDLLSYPFPHHRRNLIFVDASGERFENLFQDPAKGKRQISEADVDFLRIFAKRLSGVVLLLNLYDLWNGDDKSQVEVLRSILILLRWLKGGGVYQSGARSFQDQIDAQVPRMKRLRVPVQLLLSRADELVGLPLPESEDAQWLGQQDGKKRLLFPPGEEALFVVQNHVPRMLDALIDHVHQFRVDFVHSLTLDRETGAVKSHRGCGVELSREWLMAASRFPRLPDVPTRWWLAGQRFVDEKILRRSRWYELPPSRKLGAP